MNQNSEIIVEEDIHNIIQDIKDFSTVLQKKRVLVVGGRGFLGTYFVKTLLKLNEIFQESIEIVVIDNLVTAKEKEKFKGKNITFLKADISKKIKIKGNIHFIIHAASIASPPIYRKFPIKTIDVNYQGTRNLLELAKEKKVERILFLSSSEIYGDPHIVPTPETYYGFVSNTGPRACYDESKRLGETICILYHQQFGTPVVIARPFNVYGPFLNLDDGRIIPDFMKNAIESSRIIIHSDGTPTRSFCYVSDAIRGFFRVMLLGSIGSIYNVGNDEEISVRNVAELIKKIIGNNIKIELKKSDDPNYVVDNPKRRCPDLSKIKKSVNFNPEIKLEEGLKRLYRWYLENMS